MYSVYVLLLKNKRLYVGMTKTWRLHTRFLEHLDPECPTTKWTSKYQTLKKIHVFSGYTRKQCNTLENLMTECLMKSYGLDSCRGGKWNMVAEAGKWWVPHRLHGVPFFTEKWINLSVCTFAQCVENDPTLSAILSFFQALQSSRARSFLVRALDVHPRSIPVCSSSDG